MARETPGKGSQRHRQAVGPIRGTRPRRRTMPPELDLDDLDLIRSELAQIVKATRWPLSPRIQALKRVLAKLDPNPVPPEPLPAPKAQPASKLPHHEDPETVGTRTTLRAGKAPIGAPRWTAVDGRATRSGGKLSRRPRAYRLKNLLCYISGILPPSATGVPPASLSPRATREGSTNRMLPRAAANSTARRALSSVA